MAGFCTGDLVIHTKSGGSYTVLAYNALMENDKQLMAVYQSMATSIVWIRPVSEFNEKFTLQSQTSTLG